MALPGPARSTRGFALACAISLAIPGPGRLAQAYAPREGGERIGSRAPAWRGLDWVQGGPLSLAQLQGKVVLLRFWTAGCSYCAHTAPALRAIAARYRDAGLVVVGIHHPKEAAMRELGAVRRAAADLGFDFPIAQDLDWQTVRAYGVGRSFLSFTSVSFLIDRRGVIRWLHDGGEYHRGGGPGHEACADALGALTGAIERELGSGGKR